LLKAPYSCFIVRSMAKNSMGVNIFLKLFPVEDDRSHDGLVATRAVVGIALTVQLPTLAKS